MNKNVVHVPKGVRYISEWEDFSLPLHPCIIDKQITGCGFTEYCITNNQNIILCSPRRILLENKEEQHSDTVFYFKNDLETPLGVDKDLATTKVSSSDETSTKPIGDRLQYLSNLKSELMDYVVECKSHNTPCKILVTYDSFRLVREVLGEWLSRFHVIIDEFQSIFVDSRFKSSTEIEFIDQVRDIQRLCFVSATPMMDKYLDELDEFKDLPFLSLDWETEDPSRTIKPQLNIKSCHSILSEVSGVIEKYKSGHYDKSSWIDKETGRICEVESKEAVIYVNSVKNICDIISKCGLTLDNTNVLCSNTPNNLKKIRKAFKLNRHTPGGIGKVPKRGEIHKTFTLCTRTVYLGADFYSTCAQSFVFSDANVDCLAVDITLDLPQILGRQRLIENPWKNCANLFYKTTVDRNIQTPEEFNAYLEKKKELSYALLRTYERAVDSDKVLVASTYEDRAEDRNYREDYVAVSTHSGSTILPVFNNLVFISERRAFEIQQIDYKDRFTVFASLGDNIYSIEKDKVDAVVDEFENLTQFTDKMRLLCENSLSEDERVRLLNRIPKTFKNYYDTLGPEKCRALSYQKSKLEAEYSRIYGNQDIDLESLVYSEFQVGERYTNTSIKSKLSDIYKLASYNSTPKASDIDNFFELKTCLIPNDLGKKDHGYIILRKKGE